MVHQPREPIKGKRKAGHESPRRPEITRETRVGVAGTGGGEGISSVLGFRVPSRGSSGEITTNSENTARGRIPLPAALLPVPRVKAGMMGCGGVEVGIPGKAT